MATSSVNSFPPPPSLGVEAPPSGGDAPPFRGPPPITDDMEILIDKSVYEIVEVVLNCGLINLVCLLGSLGNALNIYVLSKHGLNSSINIVLVSLAFVDLLLLLTLPLRKISLIIAYFDEAYAMIFEAYVICYQFLTLNRVWALISHTHVVIIAAERFLAVYFPFKVKQVLSPGRMKIVTICTHVAWYLLLTPMFTMFELIWVQDPRLNATVAISGISEFYLQHESAFNFYFSFAINLLTGGLQLLLVFGFSVAIGVRIIQMGKKRLTMVSGPHGTLCTAVISASTAIPNTTTSVGSGNRQSVTTPGGPDLLETAVVDREEDSGVQDLRIDERSSEGSPTELGEFNPTVTSVVKEDKLPRDEAMIRNSRVASTRVDMKAVRMLLTVCLIYLGFVFPTFFLYVFQYVYDELKTPYWHRVNFVATSVHMLLLAINSSANFLVYVATSHKFYVTLKSIFLRCGKT